MTSCRFGLCGVAVAATMALGLTDITGRAESTSETLAPDVIDYPGATATFARGINNSGQIVGNYTCATACTNPQSGEVSSPGGHGFLYENGSYTRLDVPASGAFATNARGIGPQGIVVGHYAVRTALRNADGTPVLDANGKQRFSVLTHGFTYSTADDTWTYPVDVPMNYFDHPQSLEPNTLVVGISPQGDLVGCFHEDSLAMTTMHGWLWHNGEFTVLATSASDPSAHDPDTMNNAVAATGRIAGFYFSSGISYVADESGVIERFMYGGDRFTLAWSINARGDVVGVHGINAAGDPAGAPLSPRGFLRDAHGDFRDLTIDRATAVQVFGLNDARDVAGTFTDSTGRIHGFAARISNRGNR